MAKYLAFPSLSFYVYILVGVCLYAGSGQADRYVKTALPAGGENQTQFVGLASNQTFNKENFVIAKFLGIPFVASQPERFAKPQLGDLQAGLIKALQQGPSCMQKRDPYHLDEVMSEECLYLNIFVPTSFSTNDLTTTTTTTTTTPTTSTGSGVTNKPPTADSDATNNEIEEVEPLQNDYGDALTLGDNNGRKLAVYVYIYGGAFVSGSANSHDGTYLAQRGNVIVVALNYRLGALGFLYTNDGAIPGNLGLWDQHTAIQWVKRYIHLFGGDPDRITVGGQSAGSYSSILQALYEPNDQLFHRVLAQSGTPVARGSVTPYGHKTAIEVAKLLNCSLEKNPKGTDIKDCLLQAPAQGLADARPPPTFPTGLPIQPILDGDFVKEDPAIYLSQALTFDSSVKLNVPAHFAKKDLLIGIDAQDGEVVQRLHESSLAAGNDTLTAANLKYPIDQQKFRELIAEAFRDDFGDEVDDILVESVVDRYTNWQLPNDNVSLSNQAMELFTDMFFAIPSLDTASSHVQANDQVSATHETSTAPAVAALRSSDEVARAAANNASPQQTSGQPTSRAPTTFVYRFNLPETNAWFKNNIMPWFEGTHHGAEIDYVFGQESNVESVTKGLERTKNVMTYWTNFVKTGDPNNDDETPRSDSVVPKWEKYTQTDQYYLDFTFDPEPESKQRLIADRRHFWSDYMPRLRHRLRQVREEGARSVDKPACPKPNSGLRIDLNPLLLTFLLALAAFLF